MLTIESFNTLKNSSKLQALESSKATYLEVYYILGPYKVALFFLQGFYVSVWYNKKTDRINKALAFDDYNKLDPFITMIDIGKLK